MAKPPRKRRLSPNARRALELLASSPHGATEETLVFAYRISRHVLGGLVRSGLATVRRRVIMAGDTPVEVGEVSIITPLAGERSLLASGRVALRAL
jgi:hypothetical protein